MHLIVRWTNHRTAPVWRLVESGWPSGTAAKLRINSGEGWRDLPSRGMCSCCGGAALVAPGETAESVFELTPALQPYTVGTYELELEVGLEGSPRATGVWDRNPPLVRVEGDRRILRARFTLTIEGPRTEGDRAAHEMLRVAVEEHQGQSAPALRQVSDRILSLPLSRYHDAAWLMKLRLWQDRSTLSAFVDAELPLVRDPWIRREALGVAAEHLAVPGYTDQARKYIALGREPGIYRSTDFGLLFAEREVRRIEEALASASAP